MYRLLFVAALIVGVVCWIKNIKDIRKRIAEKKAKKANEVNTEY